MPLYEYLCKKCAHRFERIQKFSDRLVKKCPECGGAIYLDTPDGVVQLNCHTGHAYSANGLLDGQKSEVENALWTATALLEERAASLRKVADHFARSHPEEAGHYQAEAQRMDDDAMTVKNILRMQE